MKREEFGRKATNFKKSENSLTFFFSHASKYCMHTRTTTLQKSEGNRIMSRYQQRPEQRYRKKRMKRKIRNRILLVSSGAMLLTILCLAFFLVVYQAFRVYAQEEGDANPNSSESASSMITSSAMEEITSSVVSQISVEFSTSSEGSSSANSQAAPTTPDSYDYTKPVPKNQEVSASYFKDAVFLGDSRMEGFMLYSGIEGAKSYTYRGLMVDTVMTKPVIPLGGKTVSIMDALAQNPSFSKVYILFGTNELGWSYSSVFQKKYGELIDRIREINPNAQIYIQSVLPVSEKKSETDSVYNNKKIAEYNQLLQELAAEKKVFYVNVAEAVADSKGNLPDSNTVDGVHLKKAACEKWLAYLSSHTVAAN